MDAPLFPDKSAQPDDDDVRIVLGRAMTHWEKLIAAALATEPTAYVEWKFYMKKTGWSCVVRGKKRNVLYLRPIAKRRFAVTYVFGDKAVQEMTDSNLPTELIDEVRRSKKYVEGRLARVEVSNAAEAKIAHTLLAIKAAH